MMRLWILRPVRGWPSYDCCFGVVARATSEKAARKLAASVSGAEGSEVWLKPSKTTCEQLRPNGRAKVVLRDFAAG